VSTMRWSRTAPPWQAPPQALTPAMHLRLAVLQHEPETALGALAGVLDAAGVEYHVLDAHRVLRPPHQAARDHRPGDDAARQLQQFVDLRIGVNPVIGVGD
jgi:hypothetical protein